VSSKKLMIVSGDSFTTSRYISMHYPKVNTNWTVWPELVADKLGMTCINLAKSGYGNEYIYSSLLDEIVKHPIEDIGFVCASWTEPKRMDWAVKGYWESDLMIQSFLQARSPGGDAQHQINKTLRYQYSFQQVMKSLNLPFGQIQMLGLGRHDDDIKRNKYKWGAEGYKPNDSCRFKFDKTFIDYTRHYKWGAESEIVSHEVEKGYRIGPADEHFNEKGHKLFADYILDCISKKDLLNV